MFQEEGASGGATAGKEIRVLSWRNTITNTGAGAVGGRFTGAVERTRNANRHHFPRTRTQEHDIFLLARLFYLRKCLL